MRPTRWGCEGKGEGVDGGRGEGLMAMVSFGHVRRVHEDYFEKRELCET